MGRDLDIAKPAFYQDILCELYERLRYGKSDPRIISVTEITQCLLYSYFHRHRNVCVPQIGSLVIGTAGHRMVMDILSEKGLIVERFVYAKRDNIKLIGRVDVYDPNTNTVIEIKFLRKIPPEPYKDHVLQTAIYKEMINADRALLVYIQTDDLSNVKIWRIKRKHNILDYAFERAKTLSESLLHSTPPKPEKGRWCRYCPYAFDCASLWKKLRKTMWKD